MFRTNRMRIELVSMLAIGFLAAISFTQARIKNPDTMIWMTYGSAVTLDPAYAYDTASGEIIFNVYESLLRWPYGIMDGKVCDYSYSLDPSELQPMLADSWEVSDDGLTYTFHIREGVKFHEGGTLTPEDVEYTFERGMLQDRDGGPQWFLFHSLTCQFSLRDLAMLVLDRDVDDLHTLTPEEQAKIYHRYIDPAVEVDGENVVFQIPVPDSTLITELTHSVALSSILDKEWCIKEAGCWDGQPDTWEKWWNPGGGEAAEESELYDKMNGTGPFRLKRWDPGVEVVLERFDSYWREPTKLKRAIIKKASEWSDRLLAFKAGDVDICAVPHRYQPQVEGLPGIVSFHHLPTLSIDAAFYVAPLVTEGNEFIGEGPWDGYAIPPDMFADIKVRKAFAMAFDYDTYIDEFLLGQGYKTHGPIPKAFDWAYNPDPSLVWEYDLEAATDLMKEARDGELWEKGFNLTILYNEGSERRRVVCEIFEANIEAMNPKFQVTCRSVSWDTYVSYMVTSKQPLFIMGWQADFPHPYNFVVPFVTSYGTFASWQGEYIVAGIFKACIDPVVEEIQPTVIDIVSQAEIYHEIAELAHEHATHVWLPQAEGIRNIRDWVQEYPFNPIFPGPYFYPMYKAYE